MNADGLIYVSLGQLMALQFQARDLSFVARQPQGSILAGNHASRLRGRGLNFDELRRYLPGDDLRHLDWRASLRTGKPVVRTFTESAIPRSQRQPGPGPALKKDTENASDNAPEVKPDAVKFYKAAGKGKSKAIQTEQASNDALWLQNLTTSPANFLLRKFSLQDLGAQPGTGSAGCCC